MAFPLSPSLNLSIAPTSRITCFSKKHHAKEAAAAAAVATSAETIMKRLRSVVPVVIASVQISALVPVVDYVSYPGAAEAVLYSPDTKVPRTGEVALRRAIPANASMKAIQDTLEDISYLLRIPQRKPYGSMEGNVKKALKIAVDEKDSILASIPAELKERGSLVLASLTEGKGGLQTLIQSIKEQDADKVSVSLASTLDTVAELELLQAQDYHFCCRSNTHSNIRGRGTVEFTIEKGDGSTFSPVAGQQKNTATIQRLRSVVPVVIASVQITALVPVVDYVSYPGAAEAVLYSPDTKVPRTGEVALRRAIPANASMKAIQGLVLLVNQSVLSLVEHGQGLV